MREYVIHPLVVGANETDQGVMTYLKGYGKRIWIPIYVFYLEGGPEKILVDTGLEQFMVPAEVGERYGLKIQEFEAALDTYGLKPEDIDIVIHTHLHNDHCENDYKCTRARFYVQKKEFKSPIRWTTAIFPTSWMAWRWCRWTGMRRSSRVSGCSSPRGTRWAASRWWSTPGPVRR
jgi:hypothetical protein